MARKTLPSFTAEHFHGPVSNANWMARYADVYAISDWAYEDVCWAVGCGLMRGKSDSTINPLELATRAEVAQVIKNLCDKLIYQ